MTVAMYGHIPSISQRGSRIMTTVKTEPSVHAINSGSTNFYNLNILRYAPSPGIEGPGLMTSRTR
jgi:hypothetical protein